MALAKRKIMLVEDERSIGEPLAHALERVAALRATL
jgi:hypothetical protein